MFCSDLIEAAGLSGGATFGVSEGAVDVTGLEGCERL